jgi:CHAT domain-containing protein
MANEFVGLPTAFMSIGAMGVVSSLWPASDGPTLFLMVRLITELKSGERAPAHALGRAQAWLSSSTGAKLANVLRSLRPKPGSEVARLEQTLRIRYHDSRPYAEPWAWAGFFYSGRMQ